jgi:hypothetical protein
MPYDKDMCFFHQGLVWFMVFNNITVLLMEETGENLLQVADNFIT